MKIDRIQGIGAYAKCIPVEAPPERRRITERQLGELMLDDAKKIKAKATAISRNGGASSHPQYGFKRIEGRLPTRKDIARLMNASGRHRQKEVIQMMLRRRVTTPSALSVGDPEHHSGHFVTTMKGLVNLGLLQRDGDKDGAGVTYRLVLDEGEGSTG